MKLTTEAQRKFVGQGFSLAFYEIQSKAKALPYNVAKKNEGAGFTLLELTIVLFIISLILGLSTVFFANLLPSSRLDATAKNISSTIRYARSLARISGEIQFVTIDFDSRKYGIEGRGEESIPSEINIKVIDPLSGEVSSGKYRLRFNTAWGIEGGTIVLWNKKRTVNIEVDPIVGAVVIK